MQNILTGINLTDNKGFDKKKPVPEVQADPKAINAVNNSIESFGALNPFPNKPWFSRVCSSSLLKTLCEKEKMLVTSNFSFSQHVFYLFG